jgi:hypothetical protein
LGFSDDVGQGVGEGTLREEFQESKIQEAELQGLNV